MSRGSKPHFHQRRSRRRDRGPIDQACPRICPARTCGSISSIKRAPAAAANNVEPFAWLRDVLQRMTDRHPASRLDELLPWNWQPISLKA
jgi:hypothetical protein